MRTTPLSQISSSSPSFMGMILPSILVTYPRGDSWSREGTLHTFSIKSLGQQGWDPCVQSTQCLKASVVQKNRDKGRYPWAQTQSSS